MSGGQAELQGATPCHAIMRKCECEHPSSFHPDVDKPKKSGLAEFGQSLNDAVLGGQKRACMGEMKNGKPCPCQGFVEDVIRGGPTR